MPVQVTCTKCQSKLKVGEASIGKQGKCPRCQNTFVLRADGQPNPSSIANTGADHVASAPAKVSATCECGVTLKVAANLQGKQVRCPKCQQVVVVPNSQTGTSPAPISSFDGAFGSAFTASPMSSLPSPASPAGLQSGNLWEGLSLPAATSTPSFSADNADAYTYKPSPADKRATAAAKPKKKVKESESYSDSSLSGPMFQFNFEWSWWNIRLVMFFGTLLVMGPIAAISGCNSQLTAARLEREGMTTQGTIIDAIESRRGKFGRSYTLEVAYEVEGKSYRKKYSVDWEYFYDHVEAANAANAYVEVKYAKSDPNQSQLEGNGGGGFVGLGVGLSMLAFGLVGLFYVFFLQSGD